MKHLLTNLLMNIYSKKQIFYWVQTFSNQLQFVLIQFEIDRIFCERLDFAVTYCSLLHTKNKIAHLSPKSQILCQPMLMQDQPLYEVYQQAHRVSLKHNMSLHLNDDDIINVDTSLKCLIFQIRLFSNRVSL